MGLHDQQQLSHQSTMSHQQQQPCSPKQVCTQQVSVTHRHSVTQHSVTQHTAVSQQCLTTASTAFEAWACTTATKPPVNNEPTLHAIATLHLTTTHTSQHSVSIGFSLVHMHRSLTGEPRTLHHVQLLTRCAAAHAHPRTPAHLAQPSALGATSGGALPCRSGRRLHTWLQA